MNRFAQSVVGWMAAGAALPALAQPAAPAPEPAAGGAETRAVLERYCQACHNERSAVGRDTGLTVAALDAAHPGRSAEQWEKVVRRLRNGSMPPAGRPRPDAAVYERTAAWIEARLDAAAAERPDPGRPAVLHRLNRAEYRNAVRDLLALDVDVSSLLPADTSSFGFDNIGDVLGVSPLQLESYLATANHVSRLAVAGNPGGAVTADVYKVSTELTQKDRLGGSPFGTRGGTRVEHFFPVDGEYEIRVRLARNNYGIVGLNEPHPLEITLDGERMGLLTAGAGVQRENDDRQQRYKLRDDNLFVRAAVQAGPRTVGATFLKRPSAQTERVRRPFLRPLLEQGESHELPYVGEIVVTGPFAAARPGRTPSRDRIFVCRPPDPAAEAACAREIVTTLARRAFRRPATGAELDTMMAFFAEGRRGGGFESGIERALTRILVSPAFLFRLEADPPDARPGAPYALDDWALASRLSFFLWSSIPDDELLALAEQGRLREPEVLAQQARRMLADPRADALTANFAGQWLYLRNLALPQPDFRQFPDFDDNLRHAFRRETELLFESILREDRSVVDLLAADYTFVNERLARHYGIPHVYGPHFRRVSTAGHPLRGGLLGQGSFLTVQSLATRTSPVKRGIWILENILGTTPPEPPPDVPPLAADASGDAPRSMREAMEAHRANPACAACHRLMDPLGLALENFDAVGRWRETGPSGEPIDASGALPDGTEFAGAAELRQALLAQRGQFVHTLTEKLLTYALGRGLEYYDAPAVRRIARTAAGRDHRFSALVLGIVDSVPFRMRRAGETAPAAAQN